MTHFRRLSAAGFAATAISYGPGRMGFGLFVPEFRSDFPMSASVVGFVSSLGFLGFLLGLAMAQALLVRRGPEAPVLTGLAAAAIGMAVVAAAPTLPVLAAGVFLTASSAGFAWTPFNDAVHRKVLDVDRPTALSTISTGTGLGVAAAGLAAMAAAFGDLSWRACWAVFAVAAAVALLGNRAALRGVGKDPVAGPLRAWTDLLRPEAVPLLAVGLVYGMTSAIYISFAANHVREAGGAPGLPAAAAPGLVFVCSGLFGLAGLLTGRAERALGLPTLLRLTMLAGAASVALVAAAPGSWAGLVPSAALQGLHVMVTSAVIAMWSERLFPQLPAASFTAALLATAAGSVLGPALAGMASDAFGPEAMLLAAALPPAVAAAALRERHAHSGRPAAQGRHEPAPGARVAPLERKPI